MAKQLVALVSKTQSQSPREMAEALMAAVEKFRQAQQDNRLQ